MSKISQIRDQVISLIDTKHFDSKEVSDFFKNYSLDKKKEFKSILLLGKLKRREDVEALQGLKDLIQDIYESYDEKQAKAWNHNVALKKEQFSRIRPEQKNVLEARNLFKAYPGTNFKLEVDKFELPLGTISALVGKNASGKSTLYGILAGERAKTSGDLTYFKDGKPLKKKWREIKKMIAYVPQELPPWNDSLLDTLHYEASLHGLHGKANKEKVEFYIHRLDLWSYLHKQWSHLSGGYKLRFALARALVKGAQILLLDEPLASLDINSQQLILDDLYNLTHSFSNPLSVFISSQHIHEIEFIADYLYYIEDGKLENLGAVDKYKSERDENIFEFSCNLSLAEVKAALDGFKYLNLNEIGISFVLSTNTDVKMDELISYLSKKKIYPEYFRDISQSVKMRFYVEHIG